MDQAIADHRVGQFDDNGGYIALCKKAFAIERRGRFEPVLVEQRRSEDIEGVGVHREQIGRQTGEHRYTRFGLEYRTGRTPSDEIAVRPFQSSRARRTADLEGLLMLVIIPVGMRRRAECHFECELLTRIAVEIEPEGVNPFLAECVRSGQSGVGIDGHRHHRRSRPAGEEIKVTQVDARIFACGRRVEMMGHREPPFCYVRNAPNTRVQTPSNSAGTHFSAGQRLQL